MLNIILFSLIGFSLGNSLATAFKTEDRYSFVVSTIGLISTIYLATTL